MHLFSEAILNNYTGIGRHRWDEINSGV